MLRLAHKFFAINNSLRSRKRGIMRANLNPYPENSTERTQSMLLSLTPAQLTALNERLLAAPTRAERIDLLNEIAWLERERDMRRCEELCQEAHALATTGEFASAPYPRGVIAVLRTMGYVHILAGQYARSGEESMQALELLRQAPDPALEIEVRRNLTWSLSRIGELERAMVYALPALELAREQGDRQREAEMLDAIGAIYSEAGENEQANEYSTRALDLFRELGDRRGEAIMLNNVGCYYLELGEFQRAVDSANACLQLAHASNFTALSIAALSTAGEAYLGLGQTARAIELLDECLELAREHHLDTDRVYALLTLGHAYLDCGSPERAVAYLKGALAGAQENGLRTMEYKCHALLAAAFERQKDYRAALHHYQLFHTIRESILYKSSRRLHSLPALTGLAVAQRDLERYYRETLNLQAEIEQHKRTEETLHDLATRDPLTNVWNRRHFLSLAEDALRACGADCPVSMVLFDLDHFKAINDTFGHTVGDQVLQTVARLVRDNLRDQDVIGRFGGEEFILLLPNTARGQAGRLAERLRALVHTQVTIAPGISTRVSISLGVAQAPGDGANSILNVIQQADEALYRAKRRGRNRTVVAEDAQSFMDASPEEMAVETPLFPPNLYLAL